MSETYTTYEAKAHFSEVMRKVRAGQRVVIAYRGEEVAEIRPLENATSLTRSIKLLEEQGLLSGGRKPKGRLRPLAKKPGALRRFLASRE